MIKYFLALVFLLSVGVSGLKWIDKRNVTTSLGKKYACFYTIIYNSTYVNKQRSSVVCTPNTNGGLVVENFKLPSHGPIRLQHNVRDSNPEAIKWIAALESMPVQAMPLNCSCSIPMSGLMGSEEMIAAGRSIMQRASNREMAEGRLLFGPLLFFLLLSGQLTNLINALTGAAAGRSVNIEASSEDVDRIMEAVRSGDTAAIKEEDRTLLFLLIQQQIQTAINNIRTQIQTAINNFLASIGLGVVAGRNLADIHHIDLTDEANDRSLLLTLLFQQICTQIQTAINNFLAALGLTVAGRSLNRQFDLLGGGFGDLGSLTGDLGTLEGLLGGSLLGGATTTDNDLSSLLGMLGMSSPELTELMTFLGELEQMSDEQFMGMMMQEMGITEAELASWFSDIPLHCGCIPGAEQVAAGRK